MPEIFIGGSMSKAARFPQSTRFGIAVGSVLLAGSSLFPAHGAAANGASCAGDNGGISLSPGFCATVFADNVGHARHLVVAPNNGAVYVNTWSGEYYGKDKPPAGGFLLALKDTTGSGHADIVQRFGPDAASGNHGGTGIAYYKGGLYVETNDKIVRYALPDGALVPVGVPETILSGLPLTGDHPMHPFIIGADGSLYVDLGSATNSCQEKNRTLASPGMQPCTELETRAGTWRYDANKIGQVFSPAERYATGLRNGEGFAFDSAGRLYATQHGRDQLSQNWPKLYKPEQGPELPAEELVLETRGADFGWPECYFDGLQKKLVLAPEYHGDGGKAAGICAGKQAPVAAFPGHWAPNDLAIYNASQFPMPWQGGAFIAFHGSWNRAPFPQGGYNVVFQPLSDGKVSGPFVVFADGFAGAHKEPGRAAHRPSGLAVGQDGALYISDDQHGRIWRVTYQGGSTAVSGIEGAPAPQIAASGANHLQPPEGVHADAGMNPSGLPAPEGTTAAEVALGSRIFQGQSAGGTCAGCHGADAKGTPLAPDLTVGKFQWSDGTLAGLTRTISSGVPNPKNYRSPMPPMGGAQLTHAELSAVADYVWAISHRKAH
jgi:glucose/arabinose dehydrogenase/mono/diheme cytochrome c family protein